MSPPETTRITPASPAPAAASARDPKVREAIRQVGATATALTDEVGKVIVGKKDQLKLVVLAIFTEGSHVLLEDMPGLGKSVLASALARASGCDFKRVQFTPDLLPSDINGTFILNQRTHEFDFRPGPIFTNYLLADEINRASPKTQSAMLEAMAEKQVTVEGYTQRLPKPFVVMATQNPVEQAGTYPLPEAQMDRFAMKLSMGYPSLDEEAEIILRRARRGKDDFDVKAVSSSEQIVAMQKAIENVYVSDELVRYIATIIDATRRHPMLVAGSSPRGTQNVFKLARGWAALHGRDYVVPDDIKRLVVPVLAHRVILKPEPRIKGIKAEQIMEQILASVPVPKV
ncbi:MAG TPA: MoxR family ATPase [Candidatus Thermoplasmatota archaeon]|nr:MoxR family ATPase [Candidatus Thermoplasmatota archaeon]